jgi:hypothetical protein
LATYNPKPPSTSHPRHKHLKIGNPTTPNHHRSVTHATNTSRSATAQPQTATVNHHAITKSTEERGELWRTEGEGREEKEKKNGREGKKLGKMKEKEKK